MKVLLNPLKEQLDLPALFVELGNAQGLQLEVVAQKDEGFTRIGVFVLYAAQLCRVIMSAFFNTKTPI